MKKIFSTIVMLFSLSVFSQNNSEKLPVFENCKTKHLAKRVDGIDRFKCKLQRAITNNKISKR